MRVFVVFLCLMFLSCIKADDEHNLEKDKDEKIRSMKTQMKPTWKRSYDDDDKLDDGHFHVLLLNVLHSLSSNLKKLISGTGPAGIGFTAIVVGGHVNVKRGSPIPFSKIINEYGYGFEIENGYFVCKKNGLYHFTASVCTVTGDVWVRIYKNNVEVGYLYKDQDSKWGSGTGSIVVRMMRGDKLHLSAEKNIRIADKVTIISGFCISC